MMAHLVQSTLFALAAWLVTLTLRRNRAGIRHAVWMTASVKFLVLFSVLVAAGSRIPTPLAARPAAHGIAVFTSEAARPLALVPGDASRSGPGPRRSSQPFLIAVWTAGALFMLGRWILGWRTVRRTILQSPPMGECRETAILRRLAKGRVRAVSVKSSIEPGVFGIFRSVVVLPEDLMDRLNDSQVEAILAHEVAHVRRRDNLLSAIHTLVEVIFWFHPLVWWIGARLLAERERACDEAVLQLCLRPSVYAEGILRVCEFYTAPSPALVAGVTGAGLKRRLEEIMSDRRVRSLSLANGLLLAAGCVVSLAAPVIVGMLDAPLARAQTNDIPAFEAASIKPNTSTDARGTNLYVYPNGRLVITNAPLFLIITAAWHLPFQSPRLSGLPGWTRAERYDIEAVAGRDAGLTGLTQQARYDRMMLMLARLLHERFGLEIRSERREEPVYSVIVGKGGLKLQKSKIDEKDCPEPPGLGEVGCHNFRGGMGRGITAEAVSIGDIAAWVENWADRPVVDQTGIKGLYQVKTDGWVPMRPMPPRPPNANTGAAPGVAEDLNDPFRPTLYTIFEQMGLRLEAQKLPVDVYIIEKVDRPSQN